MFDRIFDYFSHQDQQQTYNQEDRQRAYQQYQQYRRRYQQQSGADQGYAYQSAQQSTWDMEAKYYDALEIKPGAGFEEIKAAYKTVMKKYHPDRYANNPEKQGYAQQICQKINEAYDYFKKKYAK
ncbi:MAG: DnaJ domain-containing protein [Bacteroidia bacterium]|nr:DnaJ domain-containing protein [Bacteroidia bacterium]